MASGLRDTADLTVGSLGYQTVTNPLTDDAPDEVRLVEAARDGDRTAFGRLYDRYARMVHGILLARVPLRDVDDLVHDVFLIVLPRLHSLRDARRFGAWLGAIARNRAKDYYRRDAKQADQAEELSGNEVGQQAPSSSKAEAAQLLAVIRSLPEAYRETLLLRLVEGMTGPEIAERMGLTHGSVRVNLHRGMQHLRERLAGSASDPRPKTAKGDGS